MKLSKRTKRATLFIPFAMALSVGLATVFSGLAWGKFPTQDPPETSPKPTLLSPFRVEWEFEAPPVKPPNRGIKRKIEDALQNPDQASETGNPVLDGVLEKIRQQGSLVQQAIPEIPSLRGDSDLIMPPTIASGHDRIAETPGEQACLLAEQLLKTARLLSKNGDAPGNRELIESLRRVAARCLNE